MEWIKDYWWIVLIVLAGILISGIKELNRVDVKAYLKDKPEIPPHRDNNAEWDDDDDWPKDKKK
ncbi:YpfN family protein [Rouxiella sp. T17]|uniref:UPF0370 protein O1V66_01005 n=1 Tax=Rouxiella chamberiensis TaxID=1513468 RepID=A0ABY7HQ99_9GAMM|nr:YpfN family protein [Rouxiella chamberiensis]WAT01418.1 YpfN family protein [Rouxiella chamberiensis]